MSEKVIHIHLNIVIMPDGGVKLTDNPPTHELTQANSTEHIICPDCGKDLGIAETIERQKRKIGGHKKHCKGSI